MTSSQSTVAATSSVERIFPIRGLVGSRQSSEQRLSGRSLVPSSAGVDDGQDEAARHPSPSSRVDGDDVVVAADAVDGPSTMVDDPLDSASQTDHTESTKAACHREGTPDIRRVSPSTRLQYVPARYEDQASTTTARGTPSCRRYGDEHVHVPGVIQKVGALIVLRYDGRNMVVHAASENTSDVLRHTPEQLFELASFIDLVEDSQKNFFRIRIDTLANNGSSAPPTTDIDVFPVSLTTSAGEPILLWCAAHLVTDTADLVICEFEPQDDVFHSDLPECDGLPTAPTQLFYSQEAFAERARSTTKASEPLKALEAAQRRCHTTANAEPLGLSVPNATSASLKMMEIFNVMSQVQRQLAATTSLESILSVICGLVHELTGFHRVMVYRFDADNNAFVEAELVNPQASKDLYRGE